ncbi:dynein axonemal intermediate chain 4 isoform X2 [Channa argus]
MYQADLLAVQAKASQFFLDEISAGLSSEQTSFTGSFNMPFSRSVLGSSRISSQSTLESVNELFEETFSKREVPISYPDVAGKRRTVREMVTEEMLQELIDIYITETDNILLLEIPSTSVSVDADYAETVKERNRQYVEVCKNRMGNDKYVDRSMQTFNGAAKTKEIQSDRVIVLKKGTTVTSWDIYDTLCGAEQDETGPSPEPEKADYSEDASISAETSVSVGSTASSASAEASAEVEGSVSHFNVESNWQQIIQSEKFQHCLLVMERSILGNMYQSKLAAYKQLPVLEDPDNPVKPVAMEQRTEDTESCGSPGLERLWAFTCELSRGRSVTSIAWNKKNPDLLAVGYGEFDSSNKNPGLVCCWSFKNCKWPERVFHCSSAVTALDFSANNPKQLAVGMHDGNIAIYNVSQDKSHDINSSECPNKHLGPVWQLSWTPQELGLTGERVEALFSVSEDGRISKWFVFSSGLDCIDLMKLNTKKKRGENNTTKKTESALASLTPGLCFDFHPTNPNLYLVGTGEGSIHKCSCSNSQEFLETYSKHFSPVNCIAWSPLSPDVFLSCSSDWTIQLWTQDHHDPILSFTSSQMAVCDIKWSPKWATVFGAVYEKQLEIWDLKSNILDPIIVHPAVTDVKMTTLLFATQTGCVLVGDSDGQLTVYKLKNLSVGESSQVDILEALIFSAASSSSRKTSRSVSVSGTPGVSQLTRRRSSVLGSLSWRRSSVGGGSKVLLEKSSGPTPREAVRVFDEEGNDVTPQPLYQADPGAVQAKGSQFFMDEISAGSSSDQTTVTGSFNMPFSRSVLGSSRISSQSTLESVNEEIEETFSKRDVRINYPDVAGKRCTVREMVTEEMLQELIDIYITETDNISLLEIPSTSVSVDADYAEAVQERNSQYVEVCKNRMGNDKYVDRSMQTFNGAAKTKEIQRDRVIMVNKGTTVTSWDIYDTLCGAEQDETGPSPEPEKADYSEDASISAETSVSVGSTASSASASISLKEVEGSVSHFNAESNLQLIIHSEKFQHSLLVMERSILGNMYQSKLAAYRQLPVLEDPDNPVKPVAMEQRTEDTESCGSPGLERLWAFTCELSRGRSVTSIAWNKKNPDLLAVGYGEFDSSNKNPGLVCCWSFKNCKWPERVFHCSSAVTALDFSANNPKQLAVGMHDGNIAIYNVSQDKSHDINSSECPNKHLGPVWQLSWTPQELGLTGERVEALFSVSEDGRISKWFVFSSGLDCIDLMKLKRIRNTTKKPGHNNTTKKTECVLPALTPGLCFDFHPTNSNLYLVGTGEGFIHKCSCSNSQQFLETYRKHFSPVNCIAWSPLSPDVFLSCSTDWTIQLWKQNHHDPILSFTSSQMAVCDIKWSPKWATVFGAVYEKQLEIWDLNSNILNPIIVQPAVTGVKMTTLLFATQTDCVLVGDSDGQLTVYKLKNLSMGQSSQVDILERLICSAAST